MCRGVPQAGKENTEGVESSLPCKCNAISLWFIGTFYAEIKIFQDPYDWIWSSLVPRFNGYSNEFHTFVLVIFYGSTSNYS